MKLMSTIVLLVLTAGCVALFLWGPQLAPVLKLAPQPPATSDLGTSAALAQLPVNEITRVEIDRGGKTLLILASPAEGQPLQLPGNWPIRRSEVNELLNALRDLQSRYHPIPIDDNTDLTKYGLTDSQNPIIVEIARGRQIDVLRFGEAPAQAGENPFTRRTFARLGLTNQDEREKANIEKRSPRVDYKNEIVQLGPQLLPILRRTEDVYRRRQLFPEAVRVRMADARQRPGMDQPSTPQMNFLVSDAVNRIEVDMPTGRFVIKRVAPNPKPEVPADKPNSDAVVSPAQLADCWVLVEPVRDRIDPDKLKSIITTIADIWVEQFQDAVQDQHYWLGIGALRKAVPDALAVLGGSIPPGAGGASFGALLPIVALPEIQANTARVVSTFNSPIEKYELTADVFARLQKEDGVPESLLARLRPLAGKSFASAAEITAALDGTVGNSLKAVKELEPWRWAIIAEARVKATRNLQIGRVARGLGDEEYRYAALEDNRFAFEIKADKLNDLKINMSSPTPGTKTSPADELRDPSLARFNSADVTAVEIGTLGEKTQAVIKLAKVGNEWKMEQPLADAADQVEVEALLNQLKGMEAKSDEILDGPIRVPIVEAFGVGPIEPKAQLGLASKQMKRITLTFDAKSGRQPVTYLIGDGVGETKRAVMVEGWNRVNLVRDDLDARKISRFDYRPSHYRAIKLSQPGINAISEIIVQRPATTDHPADSFTLQADPEKLDQWLITAPFKTETDRDVVLPLATGLGNLSNVRYVYDASIDGPLVSPDRLPKFMVGIAPFSAELDPLADAFYGLDKPITVTLKFSKPKDAKDVVIEIGRAHSNGDHFARLKGTKGIFTIPASVAENADRKPDALADKTIIRIPGDDPNVQALRRSMAGQDLEFTAKEVDNKPGWEMIKPIAAKADSTAVDDLVKQLAKLKGSGIADLNASDLKKYGLDPPVATITLEVIERGKFVEKALLVGNLVNDKEPDGERYVKAQGSKMVATIPGKLAKQLTAKASSFRNLAISDGFPSGDKIAIERADRKLTFAKGPMGWKVSEPLKADADDQGLRDLHDALAGKPRAEEIVEDNPKDLAKYGLDKPEHLRVFNGDKELLHLLIGSREKVGPEKKTAGFRVYAMLDKGSTVYLLDSRLTQKLTDEYRSREVWPAVRPDQVTEIAIKAVDPKDSFTFTKGPTGFIDAAKKEDALDQALLSGLLFAAADPEVDHYVVDKGPIDLKPYGLDKPRSVTITMMDGKKLSLMLGNLLDGKKFFAKVDDPNRSEVFLLSEVNSQSLNRPRSAYSVKKDEPKKEPDPKKKDEPKKEEPKKEPDPKKETEPKK